MTAFDFELSDAGQGPALLMLPGSYATPAAWRGIEKELGGTYRVLSTSLPGYGATPEIRQGDDNGIEILVEFVGQVVDAVGEPVHIVGHSFGAQLALAAMLAGRIAPLGLVSFEANPIFARPAGGPFPWRPDVDLMVDRFQAAVAANDPDAAGIIIDFYSRPGAFKDLPNSVRAFCTASAPTNLRDWHSAASFTPHFADFGKVNRPMTLVHGATSPPPIVDVTDALATHARDARTVVVDDADHFLISTHPRACAVIIEAHVARLGT